MTLYCYCCSVAQSCPTLCDPMDCMQHVRIPCISPSPRVCSNLCPLSQWCHPTISSSVISFSSHLQSFPASGSFPVSWFFESGDQSTGILASASVLPMKSQDWFPLGLTGLISLLSKGLSRVFSNTTAQKHQFFGAQLYLWSNSHIHTWRLEKIIALTIQTFVGKVMSLFFNILSMLVIAFLPRNKRLLISRLQSSSAVILEAKKIKSVTVSPSIYHEVMGPDAMILAFWTLSLHQLFHSPLSPSSRGSLVPLWIQYNSNRNSPWLWRNSGSSLYMFIHTMSFIVYERAKDKNRQNTPKEESYERTCLPDIKIILGLR